MKENWTYKKLGEVFDLQMGKTPARDNANFWNDGSHKWISIGDIKGEKFISKTKETISDEAVVKSGIAVIPKGTVIMSFKLSIGKTSIVSEDMYSNEAIMAFHIKSNANILPEYLFYYLPIHKWDANRAAMGSTLNKRTISESVIGYPSVSTQQAIVRELDGINEVLSKKREQLKELDKLAQSIFYDMFGDPVTNEKGWEVKNITDMCDAITGITYKPTDITEQGMIVLRSSNVQEGQIDLNDIVRVNTKISEKYYIQQGDILMCSRNGSFRLVGKAAIIPSISEQMTWGAFMTVLRSECNPYLLEYLRTNAFRNQLSNAKTTTVNQITIGMLGKISIPLPPLPLQQAFAEKIEKIEQMKENLKASIHETETLLASRMSYWFE